jgi:hypothetical protein
LEKYRSEHIGVTFLNFDHPAYPQQHSGFVPYLSIIDMLINIGPEQTRDLIKKIQLKS